jgi:integrase/recombinase XerD
MNLELFLATNEMAETTRASYYRVLKDIDDATLEKWNAIDLVNHVTRPSWGNGHRYVVMSRLKNYIKWRFGQSHPALSAKVKRTRPKRQRSLTQKQALELLASFDPHQPIGARNLAIIATALDTGLRLAELCRLKDGQVNTSAGCLQVITKGGEWGDAVISQETAAYIEQWRAHRNAHGSTADTLFTSCAPGKPWRALTRGGLQRIASTWGDHIGVKLSCHDLRRTFAILTTLNGAPSRVVQIAGRWANINMVETYTRNLAQDAIRPYLPVSKL